MKALFTILLLGTMSAQASHHTTCLMEVEVQDIINLDKLNGETRIFRGVIESERNQIMRFQVLKTLDVRGYNCRHFKNELFTLSIDKSEVDQYFKGQDITIKYINEGNRGSDRTTWTIIK